MKKDIKNLLDESKKRNNTNADFLQRLLENKEYHDQVKKGKIDALVITDNERFKVFTENNANETYRILIEKMHEGAVTLSEDGTILYCNSSFAKMVDYPLQKVIGSIFKNFVATSSKKRLISLFKEGGTKAVKEEIKIQPRKGKATPVLISLNAVLMDQVYVLFIVVSDLTSEHRNQKKINAANIRLREKSFRLQQRDLELKKANDNLLNLNQNLEKRILERTAELQTINRELTDLNLSKNKFLSVISHDLRNPFSAMLISVDILNGITEGGKFKEIQSLVNIINRTSHKIFQQLNELIDWAHTQRQHVMINLEKTNLVLAANQSFELLKNIAILKNIRLENHISVDMYVNADKIMLRSIFQNLVTNAIKYTPENGVINVNAERVNKMIEVKIRDTGIGIKPEIGRDLFSANGSTSKDGTNGEKGTGVGLILVKDFVMQQGGILKAETELEKGTGIIFTLPEIL